MLLLPRRACLLPSSTASARSSSLSHAAPSPPGLLLAQLYRQRQIELPQPCCSFPAGPACCPALPPAPDRAPSAMLLLPRRACLLPSSTASARSRSLSHAAPSP